jgi:hypothetical protein
VTSKGRNLNPFHQTMSQILFFVMKLPYFNYYFMKSHPSFHVVNYIENERGGIIFIFFRIYAYGAVTITTHKNKTCKIEI